MSSTSAGPLHHSVSTAPSQFSTEPFKAALRSRKPKTADALERERLVLPHLPRTSVPQGPIRTFLWTQVYKFVLLVIYTLFSIYLRLRWVYNFVVGHVFAILYYHHRTPQLIAKDVAELRERGKFPKHLSVVLEYEREDLDKLIDEVSEIACWCASAGIPRLSVYERTGILKSYISTSHRAVSQQLRSYFGRERPTLRVHAPHSRTFVNDDTSTDEGSEPTGLEVMFISEEDGRESMVDLTKTLCEMAQRGKLSSEDVSVELIDAEVKENCMGEPDLLVLFSSNITLKGYPPWQLRLTEIYNVTDNDGVGYQVFLRALHSFARTEMRFGR
ncbi:Decaprenyl diphosphate synthase-like protein [Tricharina praecox]|uniref:Decaprenyl diphosphate synthase-like protein n=1 Tax=Tricharina praecox TaxID=43433 RepID=UPI00221F0954|nr:Decaprenyl diphosphate synthase-like protein [Tricharina praecox]KAI5858563.1 Decaprenyl diphosphate synthase-like protein [Tricharina praecox]